MTIKAVTGRLRKLCGSFADVRANALFVAALSDCLTKLGDDLGYDPSDKGCAGGGESCGHRASGAEFDANHLGPQGNALFNFPLNPAAC